MGINLLKNIYVVCALLTCLTFAAAGNGENSSAFNKYMSPEGGVNPLSGTVALQKDVASISVGQLSTSLSLKYSGNIFREATRSNDEVKGGIVGLGWSMGRAKIVCDCKNNSFLDDDVYFLITADGSRYRIFDENAWERHFNYNRTVQGEKWRIEGNPFWKVERILGHTMFPDIDTVQWHYVKGWKITDAEGIVHVYGDIQETNSLTGPSAVAKATEYDLIWLNYKDEKGTRKSAYGLMEDAYGGEPSYYPVAWNLSSETALDGSTLEYSYERITERLYGVFYWEFDDKKTLWNPNVGYTKETYLKTIRSSNNARIELTYGEKGKDKFLNEYLDDDGVNEDLMDPGSDTYRERFERKYLSSIETYGPSEQVNGEYLGKVDFCYSALQEGTSFVKRLLSAIRFYNKDGIEVDFEEYAYYTDVEKAKIKNTKSVAYPLGALYMVKGKDCGWVEYIYVYESLGNGHMEELPLDSVYGVGTLENGTTYLVGKKDDFLKIYTRILGRWVPTEFEDDTHNPIPAADRVDFGDAGWFMAVKEGSVAYIFEWNGKKWQRMTSQNYETSKFDSPFDFSDYKEEEVLAGPDYALCYRLDDEDGAGGNDGFLDMNIFWTKWGGSPKIERLTDVDDDKGENYKIVPLKNHILVQYQYGGTACSGDCLKFRVYTFRKDSLIVSDGDTHSKVDSENSIYMNGPFLADVGEGYYWWDKSRTIIRNWNGHNWTKQIRYEFNNSRTANAEVYASDYFAIRYNDKRQLRVFSFNGYEWDAGAVDDKLFDYRISGKFYWKGLGTEDFFVTTRSYREKWYKTVQENKRVKLYYHKNINSWQSIDYEFLGDQFAEYEKKMVVGKDWFFEKNKSRLAWVWNGTEWKTENLKEILDPDKYDEEDIHSLGGNMLAASANGKTRILYKVNDSFLHATGAYLVSSKKILEPVADKTIEYRYSFLPKENAENGYAFDEATNTPLMEVMKVELPNKNGIVERHLCDLTEDGERVAVGAVCKEVQRSQHDGSIISQTQTYYARKRHGWPLPLYVDQETAKVEIARGLKTVVKNTYSENNGLLKQRIRKTGLKSTVEKYVFVADLTGLSSSEEAIANKLKEQNRLNVLAGSYSCIGDCTNGVVAMASANGLSQVDNQWTVTSTWKYSESISIGERGLKTQIQNIALKSQQNPFWERLSFNSEYANKRVVESIEGPKGMKLSSFYENSELGKMLGSAANCGIKEGLMLSGESCNVANWENCEYDATILQGSAKDAVRLGRTDYMNFGRFSKRFIKLTPNKSLIGTIPEARNDEYTFSAWMQYRSVNGTLSLRVNGNTVKSWETRPSSLPMDSVGRWTRIEWKGRLSGLTTVALSVQNVSTFVPLQDIRVLPSKSTSMASFWDWKWNKVEATVDTRGVASYVGFDNLGRETESYSETADGDVYLSSKTTFVDGNCSEFPNGSDQLSSLLLNGDAQKLPAANGDRKATYTLAQSRVYVDLLTVGARDGKKYRLYAQGENPGKWESSCGPLCNPSFSFTPDKKTWILEVDVTPDSVGIYTFTLNKREFDWVEYGAYDGFAKGSSPSFVNEYDSSFVIYKNNQGKMEFVEFDGNKWSGKSTLVSDFASSFVLSTIKNNNYLAYVPHRDGISSEFPRVIKVSKSGVNELDISDKLFRADGLKVAENASGKPVLLFNKTDKLVLESNPENPTDQKYVYEFDGSLFVMRWNDALGSFEYLGYSPIFDYNKAEVDKEARMINFYTGQIKAHLPGVVNEKEVISSDVVVGPEGKLYVAYVSTSKYFDWCNAKDSNDGEECYHDVPFVYVKRLYEPPEANGSWENIWAGASQMNGAPLFHGDILSWSDSPIDAVEGAKKIKMAYSNGHLYLGVLYELPLSDGHTGSLQNPTHALSVFKGTLKTNVVVNGQSYTKYLEWKPLMDKSITATYMAKTLAEEQSRVAYLDENDDFDFVVRNDIPYLMFRNADNNDGVTVVSYRDNRWLSVGNPGFAYPEKVKGSADLGVNDLGNPFVVFTAANSIENAGRVGNVVAMHYNSKNATDLSLDKFETSDADFNKTCSFRQYILHYVANLGEVDNFVFKVTPRDASQIKEMQIIRNKKYLSTITNFANSVYIPLEKGLNKLELRLVGHNGKTLSYRFDLYRYFKPTPNFYTVDYMTTSAVKLGLNGEVVVDISPNATTENGTVLVDFHFEAGWELILNDGRKFQVSSTVELPVDKLPMLGIFWNEISGDEIPVVINNVEKPSDNPEDYPWYVSSSSGSGSEDESSSSSSGPEENSSSSSSGPDESGSSSSSGPGDGSSSSDGGGGDGGSSSSVLNEDLSGNVPDEIRNLTTSHVFASGQMIVADNVVIRGSAQAGGSIDVGASALVEGDVYSGGNVTLRNNSNVADVYYGISFDAQNGAQYGIVTHLQSVSVQPIPTFSMVPGNADVLVEQPQTRYLMSGSYGNFTARTNTTVNFAAGDYYFRDFYTDSRVQMVFEPGSRIWVGGNLRIGNGGRMLYEGRSGDLFVYVSGNVSLETNVEMHAVLVAPEANMSVSTGVHVYGYLIGKSLNIQPNVIVE